MALLPPSTIPTEARPDVISLPKDRIKILLLEGISDSAVATFSQMDSSVAINASPSHSAACAQIPVMANRPRPGRRHWWDHLPSG